MIKVNKRNGSDIRNGISAKSVSIVIAITSTYTQTKKNRRTQTIRIATSIIKGGVVATIDDCQTIAEDSMCLVQMDTIDSIGTNVV